MFARRGLFENGQRRKPNHRYMILGAMLNNPINGKLSGPWKPWYAYLLGIIVVTSLGLYVVDRVRDNPVAPTSTVPESKNLSVPFTLQAPFANWDAVREDTCEEASILMVAEYYDGARGVLDPAKADEHLLAMVDMEGKNGYGTSLTAAQLGSFAELYFGDVKATVIEDPTIDEIKMYINQGVPVVVPAAGQLLGNPFFSGEGPLYHYYVIRGYEDGKFITNDPGTRQGQNYTYSADVVMRSMGDWNNGDPANGAKRILILEPTQ